MSQTIERAAMSATGDDIAVKLRNAPAWVRSAANVSGRAVSPSQPVSKPVSKPTVPMPAVKPTARARAPVIGWLAGIGVATVVFFWLGRRKRVGPPSVQ